MRHRRIGLSAFCAGFAGSAQGAPFGTDLTISFAVIGRLSEQVAKVFGLTVPTEAKKDGDGERAGELAQTEDESSQEGAKRNERF